jgi:flagellin
MTRINTNVSSLLAQTSLAKSNAQLQQALTRLSTGLRINSGADDPAGLIASESLKSDIANTQQAVKNTTTANEMISTADSALGEVSGLLNNIRSLITSTANTAALSQDQIAANQLQVNSSLAAIDRIAQTTSFQGKNLLDGNLDFIYNLVNGSGIDLTQVKNLKISQANLSSGDMSVDVAVSADADVAEISTTGLPASTDAATTDISSGGAVIGTIDAATNGSDYNGVSVTFTYKADLDDDTVFADYNATTKSLKVFYNGDGTGVTSGDLDTAVKAATSNLFTATLTAPLTAQTATAANTAGGSDGGIAAKLAFRVIGNLGSQVVTFDVGATGAAIATGINQVSDATGVTAEWQNNTSQHTLVLNSAGYGSSQSVEVQISDDSAGTFTAGFSNTLRDTGSDATGTINGYTAVGKGSTLSINNPVLAMSVTMDPTQTLAGDDLLLKITGGGALFQLGPNVVSSQQSRIGIQSVDTGSLGGVSGRLYQIQTGKGNDLSSKNLATAAAIVDEAIDQVTTLRGTLGAFQSTTLDTNANALNDTLEALTEAKSSITDADFAAETANLTRAQILVQSGTAVLKIANQNPQNVLALLQ